MKLPLLMLFFLLGILRYLPPAEVYITPEKMGSDQSETTVPSSDQRISLQAAETLDSGVQGEEIYRGTKDRIELVSPSMSTETSSDVSLIHPAGVIDLRELDVYKIETEDKQMEEMPKHRLVEPGMAVARGQ